MFNFDFYNPTRIIFGKDRLGSIDALIPAHAAVLITYGGGSAKKSGLIDKVKTVRTAQVPWADHAFGNRGSYPGDKPADF